MKLPKSLTTVTPFSKALAAILFITFPFAGFLAGMQYERTTSTNDAIKVNQPTTYPTPEITDLPADIPVSSPPLQRPSQSIQPDEGVACTADAKMCPDGSYVSRQGPRCEFAKCPGE